MSKNNDMVQINVLLTREAKKKLDYYCFVHNSDITKEVRGDINKKIQSVRLPEQAK